MCGYNKEFFVIPGGTSCHSFQIKHGRRRHYTPSFSHLFASRLCVTSQKPWISLNTAVRKSKFVPYVTSKLLIPFLNKPKTQSHYKESKAAVVLGLPELELRISASTTSCLVTISTGLSRLGLCSMWSVKNLTSGCDHRKVLRNKNSNTHNGRNKHVTRTSELTGLKWMLQVRRNS